MRCRSDEISFLKTCLLSVRAALAYPNLPLNPDLRLKSPLVGRLPFMVVTPSAEHEGRSQVKIVTTGLIRCLTVAVSRAEVRSLWASA